MVRVSYDKVRFGGLHRIELELSWIELRDVMEATELTSTLRLARPRVRGHASASLR